MKRVCVCVRKDMEDVPSRRHYITILKLAPVKVNDRIKKSSQYLTMLLASPNCFVL